MNQELLNQLKKDPETLKRAAEEAGLLVDEEAVKLFAPIEVGELDTAQDIAKKWNEKLPKMQEYFRKQSQAGAKAVEKQFQQSEEEKEGEKIREFAKNHPEMKPGSAVVELMEQLYIKNGSLEESYKKACKAEDIAPIAIDGDKRVNLSSGKEVDKDGKEVEAEGKKTTVSSLRSDSQKAASDDVDEGELKKTEPKTTRQAAEANLNTILAEQGNPWADE